MKCCPLFLTFTSLHLLCLCLRVNFLNTFLPITLLPCFFRPSCERILCSSCLRFLPLLALLPSLRQPTPRTLMHLTLRKHTHSHSRTWMLFRTQVSTGTACAGLGLRMRTRWASVVRP